MGLPQLLERLVLVLRATGRIYQIVLMQVLVIFRDAFAEIKLHRGYWGYW